MAIALRHPAVRPGPPGPVPDGPPDAAYVGGVTRAIALAIDAAVIDLAGLAVGAIFALIFSILPVSHDFKTVAAIVGAVAFVIWSIAYFTTFWTATGQTPGNRAMRIRVVREDGAPLRPRHALARLAGMLIGLPLLWGYAPILFTDRRRGLHDAMAGTVVLAAEDPLGSDAGLGGHPAAIDRVE
jgi:uncharacterized RDD family membrane protein YckC